ncbi:hypothetical protein P7K49_013967 [Saguinus oedipus]|uniref:Uncharacterized protein n=1 Tax=Saguinus oedipus TaxID=9490 RepID=A0ABQ9VKG6_SAGOE|nr:hypothetical protein P7K49_013967 [Saguinus oedipus]
MQLGMSKVDGWPVMPSCKATLPYLPSDASDQHPQGKAVKEPKVRAAGTQQCPELTDGIRKSSSSQPQAVFKTGDVAPPSKATLPKDLVTNLGDQRTLNSEGLDPVKRRLVATDRFPESELPLLESKVRRNPVWAYFIPQDRAALIE